MSLREATAHAGGRPAGVAGDLARVEAGDVAKGQQPAVVGLQVCQRALQIDQADRLGGIATGVLLEHLGDVDDRTPSLRPHRLPSLVGGDGDEPGTHLSGSRRVCSRRHAIDHAACTESRVTSGSPHMTNTTRAMASRCSETSRVNAASSPSAASRTVVARTDASGTAMSVM